VVVAPAKAASTTYDYAGIIASAWRCASLYYCGSAGNTSRKAAWRNTSGVTVTIPPTVRGCCWLWCCVLRAASAGDGRRRSNFHLLLLLLLFLQRRQARRDAKLRRVKPLARRGGSIYCGHGKGTTANTTDDALVFFFFGARGGRRLLLCVGGPQSLYTTNTTVPWQVNNR
jgi:hypothetical protein